MGQPLVHFEVIGRDGAAQAALAKAENLGGRRVMGPEQIMDTVELGQFTDPEGHLIGVVKTTPQG